MTIIHDDLPNLKNTSKHKISSKSNSIKLHTFHKNLTSTQYLQLKNSVNLNLAIVAELKYHADAVINVHYHLKKNGKYVKLIGTGKAVYSTSLMNESTSLDQELAKLGLTGCSTIPILPKLEINLYHKLIASNPDFYNSLAGTPKVNVSSSWINAIKDTSFEYNSLMSYVAFYDLFQLGIISRLLKFYPNLDYITYHNSKLYYSIHHQEHLYGDKNNEDSSLLTPNYIRILCHSLLNNYWNHTNIHKKTFDITNMYGYLIVHIKYDGKHYSFKIINTALHKLMKLYPSAKSIISDSDHILINYDFHKQSNSRSVVKLNCKQGTYHKISNDLLQEIKLAYGNSSLAHIKANNYKDNLNGNKIISHGTYADFYTIVLNQNLTANFKPLLILRK